jgi:hypothetical protein
MGGYGGNPTGVKGLYNLDRTWIRGQVYQIGTGQKKSQKNPECRLEIAMGGGKKNIGFCRGSVCVWRRGTSNPYVSKKNCIFTKTLRYGLRRLHY